MSLNIRVMGCFRLLKPVYSLANRQGVPCACAWAADAFIGKRQLFGLCIHVA